MRGESSAPDCTRQYGWWSADLEIPLAAMSWQLFLAQIYGVPLGWEKHVLMGLAVWAVYLLDGLWDASRLRDIARASRRHQRYRCHRRVLAWALGLVSLLGGVISLEALEMVEWAGASMMGVLLALYYAVRIVFPLLKEMLCGLIFAVGVSWLVLLNSGVLVFWQAVVPLALLAMVNMFSIGVWEVESDRALGEKTVAVRFMRWAHWWKKVAPGVVLLGGSWAVLFEAPYELFVLFGMIGVFLLFLIYRRPCSASARHLWADVIFALPIAWVMMKVLVF